MASTKQMQERAKAARKAARTAAAQVVSLPSKMATKGKVNFYGFFYSPTDTDKDVLSITCSDFRGLPLQTGEMMWDEDYLKAQDEEAARDPSFVQDLFDQLESMRKYVCSKRNKMVDCNAPSVLFGEGTLGSDLALMAGNIAWLATRGHLKQSEFNGTLVGTTLGEQGYTPNDVSSHTRTLKSGKVVTVRAYSRGYKKAA